MKRDEVEEALEQPHSLEAKMVKLQQLMLFAKNDGVVGLSPDIMINMMSHLITIVQNSPPESVQEVAAKNASTEALASIKIEPEDCPFFNELARACGRKECHVCGRGAEGLWSEPNLERIREMVKREIIVHGPRDIFGHFLNVIDDLEDGRRWVSRLYSFLELYIKEDDPSCQCRVCVVGNKLNAEFLNACKPNRDKADEAKVKRIVSRGKAIEDMRRVLSSIQHECEQAEYRVQVDLGEMGPRTADQPHKDNDSSHSEEPWMQTR